MNLNKGKSKLQSIHVSNNKIYTTAFEVKIVDDYLSGKLNSYQPLPGVDEALNTIKVLDAIQKAIFSGKDEKV